MNPSTAFGLVLADELARCGLREVVVAPGSRSTPLAMAFWELDRAGRVRLHVRIDERSAAFTALGLAKASRRPVAVLCTSGTAAANFHPAVIEADESAVPLLVLTADRPPELRGTGASQTVDQVKLYGSAVRWYAESGLPERRPGMARYWRSLACRAWAHAAGDPGTLPGPVHLNLPFRDPLVPDASPARPSAVPALPSAVPARPSAVPARPSAVPARPSAVPGAAASLPFDNSNKRVSAVAGEGAVAGERAVSGGGATAGGQTAPGESTLVADDDWPDSLAGRPGGAPWTLVTAGAPTAAPLELDWAERGVVVCGEGDYDAGALVALAERAGWPVLAEPSSGARHGPNALTGYQYLLASPRFMTEHRPQVIVSAGRPGLTRPQSALLGLAGTAGTPPVRHVVITSGPGLWADPQRAASDVATAVRLTGAPAAVPGRWLGAWRRADAAATQAAGGVLDAWPAGQAGVENGPAGSDPARPDGAALPGPPAAQPMAGPARGALAEPDVARELIAALPQNALLWCGNSLSVRDVDLLLPPRADIRVIASRGASGIDGTFSTAAGAALAHAARCPGAVAFALIGDLSLLHDAPGLVIGPGEPRPDLCVVVVNNDGGGIFAGLEPAAFPGPFERVFGTPHGASIEHLAAAFGLPYTLAERPGDLAKALSAAVPGTGPQVIEARTARAGNAELRAAMRAAGVSAADQTIAPGA